MNDIYLRIKALLEDAGISFDEGGITKAEIYAYSEAIEYVRDSTASILDEVFIRNGASGEQYARLLNIDTSRYTAAELKDKIKDRLSMTFGENTVDDFETAFAEVASGSYTITDNADGTQTIHFSGVARDDLAQLGKLIEEYSCPSLYSECEGTGLDVNAWYRWALSAYQFDKMNLPFSVIETLRRNLV